MEIYKNNDVEITSERQDEFETNINVNNKFPLVIKKIIWISTEEVDNFRKELRELINKYRI